MRMCIFKQSKEAHRWQLRAKELFKEGYGDCDKISYKVIKEMQAQGLELSRDFVVVRGRVRGIRHMCLEMYGRNGKKPRINGYRIDGTARDEWMRVTFKGPYNECDRT